MHPMWAQRREEVLRDCIVSTRLAGPAGSRSRRTHGAHPQAGAVAWPPCATIDRPVDAHGSPLAPYGLPGAANLHEQAPPTSQRMAYRTLTTRGGAWCPP